MKKPDYSELEEGKDHKLVLALRHDEIIWFIRENLKPVNWFLKFFYLFNGVLLIAFLQFIIQSTQNQNYGFWNSMMFFAGGTLFFLMLIIPVHELLHLLTFKLFGAKETKVFAQWNKLLFYAVADKFVMNYREFIVLALIPFVIINSLLIASLFMYRGIVDYGIWAALIFHTTGCIGDFVLLSYLTKKENRKLLSFDDLEKGVTVFYAPVNNLPE